MDATEAKKFLMPIPKEDVIRSRFTDNEDKCCAIGHLVRLKSDDPSDYSKKNCQDDKSPKWEYGEISRFARISVAEFIKEKHDDFGDLSSVNNYNYVNGYTQDNPKDRVIALLDDMIEAGY